MIKKNLHANFSMTFSVACEVSLGCLVQTYRVQLLKFANRLKITDCLFLHAHKYPSQIY